MDRRLDDRDELYASSWNGRGEPGEQAAGEPQGAADLHEAEPVQANDGPADRNEDEQERDEDGDEAEKEMEELSLENLI